MDADETEEMLGPVYPLAQQINAALLGAVYPLSRREVVLVARSNEAPKTLLSLLEGMPDAGYRSLDDVQVAVSPPPPQERGPAPPGPSETPPASR